MRWLFSRGLRSLVLVAAGTSLVLNLALMMPAVYMMQVFERVFASRSIETLVMLSLLVGAALLLAYCMDIARARALGAAGRVLDGLLAAPALRASLDARALAVRSGTQEALRDIAALRAFLAGSGVLALFDTPWVPVYLLAIGCLHPLLGVAAALGAALLFALALLTQQATRGLTEEATVDSRRLQRHTGALLRHAEVIAGMGMAGSVVEDWRRRHGVLLDRRSRLASRSSVLAAFGRIARQALQALMLALGAWLVVGEDASPGIMVAATILLGRALQPVEQLNAGWKSLVEARLAWRRLTQPGSAPSHASAHPLPEPTGTVEFERVVFAASAGSVPLIKGVSFKLAAGECIGVVGPSAAGKSTLLRLMLGIWTPLSGAVRLDGASLTHWDRDTLGRHIGYLPQDVELFAGSVAHNIARLGPINDEGVTEAALRAGAHDMILRLPRGYDTEIGDGGSSLSGGQRQRIALARALFGNPRLVVLDEPNANLDTEGENALAAAITRLKADGVTVVVVSHRPALLPLFDRLAVLRDGVLEAVGPPSLPATGLRPVAARTPGRGDMSAALAKPIQS